MSQLEKKRAKKKIKNVKAKILNLTKAYIKSIQDLDVAEFEFEFEFESQLIMPGNANSNHGGQT